MSARGRFSSVLVSIVIALAGFVTIGALPAAAAPKAVQYVALGDSYAAGTALGRYPDCQHGDGGYPALLPLGSRIDLQANFACSGATTSDVVDNQLNQLSALNSDTAAGDPDRWCRQSGSFCCVDRVHCRTADRL